MIKGFRLTRYFPIDSIAPSDPPLVKRPCMRVGMGSDHSSFGHGIDSVEALYIDTFQYWFGPGDPVRGKHVIQFGGEGFSRWSSDDGAPFSE